MHTLPLYINDIQSRFQDHASIHWPLNRCVFFPPAGEILILLKTGCLQLPEHFCYGPYLKFKYHR